MLQGFEDQTHELTDLEITSVLPQIHKGLLKKVGIKNAVTNKEIVSGLDKNLGIKTTESRVRKIINVIRTKNMIPKLIATSKGYYIATSRKEVVDYIESLKGRENSIRQVRESIEMQLQSFEF